MRTNDKPTRGRNFRRGEDNTNAYSRNEGGAYSDESRYEPNYERPRGFTSRDYDRENYWDMPARDEEQYGTGDQRYVPEFNYGNNDRHELRRGEASGYGNENSEFMSDFERWHRHGEERGYHDYSYGFRKGVNNDHRYDYNYYESYPSYGQGAPYNDHERSYIDKQEARGNRGIDNEDDYRRGQRSRRPEVRNKRY